MATNNEKLQELSVEEKLQHLYELQRIDTEIDKIKTLRGELPLEVQDLEDEIAGLLIHRVHYFDRARGGCLMAG